jgi:dolichyl-phosphate-mannose-protein mannosyltransferase
MTSDTARSASTAATTLVALFGALGVYLLWVSLPWPLIHDAPIMHYIAERISEGAVPYRDLFDMNQPGVYLLHLAVIRTLGESDLAWRVFDLAWLALTSVSIAAFARPWGATAAIGAGVLFAVYHLASGAWQAGQRDFVLCAFLIVAALAVARWIEAGGAWRLLVAGVVLGCGITLKPHALLFALALGAVALVAAWRAPIAVPRSTAASALGAYVIGLVVPPVIALGWVAARGGFAAWRDIVFDYLIPLYSGLSRAQDWQFWRGSVWIALGTAALVSLGAAAWRRRLTWRHGIAAVGLAYGALHFVGQRKGWEYHLYPLAAFTAVLAFSEITVLIEERRLILGGVLAVSLVGCLALLTIRGRETANAAWIWDKEYVVRLLAHDLGERMRAGDGVQVFDTTEGAIHALLRLHARQSTRFLYDFHFFHDVDHPTIQRLRAELVSSLQAQPPRFIVVFERGWPAGGLDRFQTFPELSRFMEERYTAVQRRAGYVILEARNRS